MTYTLHMGDCLSYMKTMDAGSVDAVVTDPPYGIDYQSAWRTDRATRFPKIAGDASVDMAWAAETYRLTSDNGCLLCFCRWDVSGAFMDGIAAADWDVRSQVVWDRGTHGMGDLTRQYAPSHDLLWFATKGNYAFPGHRPRSVYRIDRLPANRLEHPTQKPTPLMSRILLDIAPATATVLDPFMGSGTTGVACVQTGRNFIGIEIDPVYFAIAERRIREAQMQPPLMEIERC